MKIFVSYSRSDKKNLAPLLAEISAAGLLYWIDEGDILPGMSFNEEILEGLRSCDWFLIVLSPRSAQSEYVKDELHWALTHRKRRILPVMLEACDPAEFHLRLMQIQYVNLAGEFEDSLEKLQSTLMQIKTAKPEEALQLQANALEEKLEIISLLLTFIPRKHQKHLRNLRPERSNQAYQGCRSLRHELRDLCTWGLLERKTNVKLGEIVIEGQNFLLTDVVRLTTLGEKLAKHVT